MESRKIKTGLFRFRIDDDIKVLVNNGKWFLYSVETKQYPKAAYLLEADDSNFLLSQNGSILTDIKFNSKINKKERIYFNGIPFPDPMPKMCQ